MDLEIRSDLYITPTNALLYLFRPGVSNQVFHLWTGVLYVTSALMFYIVFDVGADISSFQALPVSKLSCKARHRYVL